MTAVRGAVVRGERGSGPSQGANHNKRTACTRCGIEKCVKTPRPGYMCFDCKLVDPKFGQMQW